MKLWLKNLLFIVLVPGTVVVWLPWWILSASSSAGKLHNGLALAAWITGLLVILAGLGIAGCCVKDFMRIGRGTPAPIDPPKVLVIQGLYRRVRNPMYLGVLLILAGESLATASIRLAAYSLLVFCCFHLFVVFYEEPVLRRRFGAS